MIDFTTFRPDQLSLAIAQCATMGVPDHAALFRAVRDKVVGLVYMKRASQIPKQTRLNAAQPRIVLLGDDDYQATGPAGWRCWDQVRPWAQAAFVHAAGATAGSYRIAIVHALLCHRVVLIETDCAHAHAWDAALQKANIPVFGILPADGQHPVAPQRKEGQ